MRKRVFLTVVTLLTFIVCSSVLAQSTSEGAFDTWTTRPFERIQSSDHSYLRAVHSAKQGEFDRVVFEFEGPIPNYSIKYLPSRYFESERGRERIRIAGNSFVHVNLHTITTDEKQLAMSQEKGFRPKGRLRMPSLQQIADHGLFEGYYDFLIGLLSRRPFRVSQLSNPSRLVIDFKH